jgi:hemoglobin/transferrin/lactoferrin receptor protein
VLSRFKVGDNGMGRTGMVAVAGKTDTFALQQSADRT